MSSNADRPKLNPNPPKGAPPATPSKDHRPPPLEAKSYLEGGAEAGVARFCEENFVSPEGARSGAEALLNAFDNSGLWLSNLIQPVHLLAELRQGSCTLTRVIVTQWTKQGETHKLSRLGAALLEAQPPLRTHEGGQIMALLASILGILRPQRAQQLLEKSRPLLRDSLDLPLLNEASQWVTIGCILEDLPAEDRLFWNRQIREPSEDWQWDTAAARGALQRLAPLIKLLKDEDLTLFQKAVPGCWWDVVYHAEGEGDGPNQGHYNSLRVHSVMFFVLGLLIGVMGTMMFLSFNNMAPQISALGFAQSVETPESGPAQPATNKASPLSNERRAEIATLTKNHADLQRLHKLVKSGSLRENEALINGQSGVAPLGSPPYRLLIRLLLLDPPEQKEVRQVVTKLATRAVPPAELLQTLKLCIYPGSPNEEEARQCAAWMLELDNGLLTKTERQGFSALQDTAQK